MIITIVISMRCIGNEWKEWKEWNSNAMNFYNDKFVYARS